MNICRIIFWTLFLLFVADVAFPQTVTITDDPDYDGVISSAVLELYSEQAGFLMPRMTQSQRDAIPSPAKGLILFQTDEKSGFYYNAGSAEDPFWVLLGSVASVAEEFSNAGSVWDIDGNHYPTVIIGEYRWMAQNLRVTHFRNGEPIPEVASASFWINAEHAAYSIYDNMASNAERFGLLYNGFVLHHPSGICPEGWMIPDNTHWQSLAIQSGGAEIAGKELKAAIYWDASSINAFNTSGFSAMPSGFRSDENGTFTALRNSSSWWSFTDDHQGGPWGYKLHAGSDALSSQEVNPNSGHAIRCVREIP